MKISSLLLKILLGVGLYLLLTTLLQPVAYHFYAEEGVNLFINIQSEEDNTITLTQNNSGAEDQNKAFKGGGNSQLIRFALPANNFDGFQLKFDKTTAITLNKIEFERFGSVFSISPDRLQDYFQSCTPSALVGTSTGNNLLQLRSCIQSKDQLLDGFNFVSTSQFNGDFYVRLLSLLIALCFFVWSMYSGVDLDFNLNKLFIFLFFGLLLLPALDENFQLDHTTLDEKREYATKPELGLEGIGNYAKQYNSYYNDQFGFRNWLLDKNAKFKHDIFGESTSDKVIGGRKGWWFFNNEVLPDGVEYMFSDYTHRNLLNEAQLQEVKSTLERRKTNMEKMGIAYYAAYFPNKHTVYRAYLPWRARMATVGNTSRMEQISQYLQNNNSTVSFIDVTATLLAQKNNDPLYLKYDTHWNEYGAYLAYQKIFETISSKFPGLQPLTNYEVNWIKDLQQYDAFEEQCPDCYDYFKYPEIKKMYARSGLAIMMGTETSKTEILEGVPILKFKEQVSYQTTQVGEGRNKEKYLVYENPHAKTNKTLLVFRDSYTRAIAKFYIPHFKKVVFVWGRFKLDVIRKEKPDIVLDTHVERYAYTKFK